MCRLLQSATIRDMDADFDLDKTGKVTPVIGRGGARAGAGRKKGYSPKKARQMEAAGEPSEVDDQDESTAVTSTALKKARAIARKEEALAGLNELELKIKSGEYLSRAAFREASATLLAELAQTLRSLPDSLERKHSLPPKVVLQVEQTIDDALSSVAAGLSQFVGGLE